MVPPRVLSSACNRILYRANGFKTMEVLIVANIDELEARIQRLEDIEAIKRLKAKYFRCLDSKLWDEMAECFTEDATTDYTDGQYRVQGKEKILRFLKAGVGRASFFGFHHGHHPEIEITSDATARGVWSSEYYMIDNDAKKTMHCGSFYYDDFAKADGEWKIRRTGYSRIFEESWDRDELKGLNLLAARDFS
jgi:bile-acid 7alpha-dehydratase